MALTSLGICCMAVHFVGSVPLPLIIRVLASLVFSHLMSDDIFGFGYLVLYAVVFVGAGFPGLIVLDRELAFGNVHLGHATTYETWFCLGLEEVSHAEEVVMTDAHLEIVSPG